MKRVVTVARKLLRELLCQPGDLRQVWISIIKNAIDAVEGCALAEPRGGEERVDDGLNGNKRRGGAG